MTDLGGFGALFGLNKDKYAEPVLVSGTDGVGTKLKIAFAMDKHDTIGIDAVAMCVNDIVVQGQNRSFSLIIWHAIRSYRRKSRRSSRVSQKAAANRAAR